jgi:hypothetical protein
MRNIFHLLFLIILITVFSCEDSEYATNCDECRGDEPVEAVLSAKLDENYYSGGIIIKIYEGKISDNVLYDSVRVFSSKKYEKRVPLNKQYTVTATYMVDGKSYTATDSTTPKVKYTETLCTEPCYFVYNRKLNLTRKYM